MKNDGCVALSIRVVRETSLQGTKVKNDWIIKRNKVFKKLLYFSGSGKTQGYSVSACVWKVLGTWHHHQRGTREIIVYSPCVCDHVSCVSPLVWGWRSCVVLLMYQHATARYLMSTETGRHHLLIIIGQ